MSNFTNTIEKTKQELTKNFNSGSFQLDEIKNLNFSSLKSFENSILSQPNLVNAYKASPKKQKGDFRIEDLSINVADVSKNRATLAKNILLNDDISSEEKGKQLNYFLPKEYIDKTPHIAKYSKLVDNSRDAVGTDFALTARTYRDLNVITASYWKAPIEKYVTVITGSGATIYNDQIVRTGYKNVISDSNSQMSPNSTELVPVSIETTKMKTDIKVYGYSFTSFMFEVGNVALAHNIQLREAGYQALMQAFIQLKQKQVFEGLHDSVDVSKGGRGVINEGVLPSKLSQDDFLLFCKRLIQYVRDVRPDMDFKNLTVIFPASEISNLSTEPFYITPNLRSFTRLEYINLVLSSLLLGNDVFDPNVEVSKLISQGGTIAFEANDPLNKGGFPCMMIYDKSDIEYHIPQDVSIIGTDVNAGGLRQTDYAIMATADVFPIKRERILKINFTV